MVTTLIAYVAATFAEMTIATIVTNMAVSFALSFVVTRVFGQTPPTQQDNGMRQQIPPSATNGLPIVYGDAYLGGTFIDAVLSQNQKQMYYVLVISSLSPDGTFEFNTSNMYYGDRVITFDATDLTKVVSLTDQADPPNVDTTISGSLFINLYTSDEAGVITPVNTTQMPSVVMSTSGDENSCPAGLEWTGTRQMNGLAFAIVRLVYSRESQTTSLQPITFYVSQYLNGLDRARAGDVWYDYMNNPKYGGAIDVGYLDTTTRDALNTYGDQLITFTDSNGDPATQRRYLINGVLNAGETVLNNVDKILMACDSWMAYQAVSGKWSIIINKAESTAYAFDDSNIVGDIRVGATDITNSVNQIEAKFPFKGNRDQPDYVNIKTPDGLLWPNEPINKASITYDLVNDSVQTHYLANRILEQAREDLIVSFNTTFYGIQVDAGSVISVTNADYGWSNKLFRVMKVNEVSMPDGNLGARLELNEYNAQVYDDKDITQFTPAPNSGLPSPVFFSSLAIPTFMGYPSASFPHFDISVFVPVTGRVTFGNLYYTTVSSPTIADWKLLASASTANSQPVANNTYYTFSNQTLGAGTYYFAYLVGNDISQSALSTKTTAQVWSPIAPTGPTGPSGPTGSGATGPTGSLGLTTIAAYKLFSQTTGTPSTPSPTSGSTIPTGWSTVVPSVTVGDILWTSFGTYNSNGYTYLTIPANTTVWGAPIAASVFQDIESDNWNGSISPTGPWGPTGSAGYYIQKASGNMWLNSVFGRGQTIFGGNNPATSFPIIVQGTTYSIYYSALGNSPFTGATPANSSNVGLLGIGASTSGGTGSFNIGVVGLGFTGSGIPNSIGGFFSGTTFASYHQGDVVFDDTILYWNGITVFGPPSTGGINYFLRGDGTWALLSSVGGGTVTSVSGTGTVSGLTLTGTVTTSGSLTLGGSLSLTSGQITSGLGFTPYNSTNPDGFITNSTSSLTNYTTTSATLSYLSANYTPTGYASHQFNADTGTAYVSGGAINIYVSITGFQSSGSGNTITIQNVSDRKLKENIVPETFGIDFINKLKPVTYKMIKGNGRTLHGFVAQDIETLIDGDNDALKIVNEDGTKGVDYLSLIAPMVKAMQEMSARIKELEDKLA
jgi:hypothetical protein